LAHTRRQHIKELLEKQEKLKVELADAKGILMVDPTSWSYDRKLTFRSFTLNTLVKINHLFYCEFISS